MNSLSFPIKAKNKLVADASVVINLNATDCAFRIIRALPNPIVVTQNVLAELSSGSSSGHKDAEKLHELIDSGIVRIVRLGHSGTDVYASLIEGTASHRTLTPCIINSH